MTRHQHDVGRLGPAKHAQMGHWDQMRFWSHLCFQTHQTSPKRPDLCCAARQNRRYIRWDHGHGQCYKLPWPQSSPDLHVIMAFRAAKPGSMAAIADMAMEMALEEVDSDRRREAIVNKSAGGKHRRQRKQP
jgi:hypothetical protein